MKARRIDNKNAVEVQIGPYWILFSYGTPVAYSDGAKVYRTEKFWSVTTSGHINRWVGGSDVELVPQDVLDGLFEKNRCPYHQEGWCGRDPDEGR